jgi:hypothetical protein
MNTQDSKKWEALFAKALSASPAAEFNPAVLKGGPGSGHWGHSGRPGRVGGSAPGGVAVGRADADDADEQFKFSGKAHLFRPNKPGVHLEAGARKVRGRFEVHGHEDGRSAVLRVGRKSVKLDHDELHSLRTKMRWLHSANEQEVTDIAGRGVARGHLHVKVGRNEIHIPINADSVKEVDAAVQAARGQGYSLTQERKSQVRDAVREMQAGNPVSVLKKRGFSKSGQLAAFIVHVEKNGDHDLARMVEKAKLGAGAAIRAYLDESHKALLEHRNAGREARKKLSGTQAVEHYRKAAIRILENHSRWVEANAALPKKFAGPHEGIILVPGDDKIFEPLEEFTPKTGSAGGGNTPPPPGAGMPPMPPVSAAPAAPISAAPAVAAPAAPAAVPRM